EVGSEAAHQVDRRRAVVGLAHDLDVVLGVEQHPEPGAHEHLIVGERDPDQPASTAAGSRAQTRKPPENRGPASTCPPTAWARSRMPAMPWPGPPPPAPLRPSSPTSLSAAAGP